MYTVMGEKKRLSTSELNKMRSLASMLGTKDFFWNVREREEVHSYANIMQGRVQEHYDKHFVVFLAFYFLAIVAPSDGSEIDSELLCILLILTAVF